MKCPACGADNERGSIFCFRCGSALQPAAPATGQTVMLDEPATTGAARTYTTPSPTMQPQPYIMPGSSVIPTTNTAAILSLVLSILSYFLLPFVGSVAGIILGYQARRSIQASNGRETGEGLATAGIIIGWVHIVLFILLALLFCVFFAGIVGTTRSFR